MVARCGEEPHIMIGLRSKRSDLSAGAAHLVSKEGDGMKLRSNNRRRYAM